MHFTLNGDQFELDVEIVTSRLRGRTPEPIQVHWVEVGSVRFPVKQALEAVLGVNRKTYTSQIAYSIFDRLGFPTSVSQPSASLDSPRHAVPSPAAPAISIQEAGAAFATLVAFLRQAPFTTRIDQLERDLINTDRTTAPKVTTAAGLTEELLNAALIVRRDVGRVSDVIHATVISLALPTILEPGEVIANRPSLGAGNDTTRPFDVETNRRVAEFKVALWSRGDMMRKRTMTADLVHLALDESGRRPELWVAGDQPLRFLRTSTSPVGGLLSRASSRHLRALYESRYGADEIPLRDFVRHHAAHVQLHNLAEVLPAVATALGKRQLVPTGACKSAPSVLLRHRYFDSQ